jgi:GNAT superfamily N-acetyltransferase
MADEGIVQYVERIDFGRDCVFAVHDDRMRWVAVVHVALTGATAELGLSALPGFRGQGNGDALLRRAVIWLRNRGSLSVYVHCLAENAAMKHLARKNGMRIVYAGSESDGRLELAAPTAATYFDEWVENQRGVTMMALRHNLRWMQAAFTVPR